MAVAKRTLLALLSTSLFLIFSPLHFAHLCWQKYIGQDSSVSLNQIKSAYARQLATVDEALKSMFPEAQETATEMKVLTQNQYQMIENKADLTLHPQYDLQHKFYVSKKEGEIIGYAALDAVSGKWGPIYYIIAFNPDSTIKNVIVLAYEEKRGQPVAKGRFLRQFQNKSTSDEIKFMKDIRGVTGASISSRGMADGVRKMTHIFEALYGKH